MLYIANQYGIEYITCLTLSILTWYKRFYEAIASYYIAVAFVTPFLLISWSTICKIYATKCMNCQHNACLESIKTSIIGRKLGKCQKA